ncbi:MAG: hypothetical protein ACK5JR_10100 [Tropicimonas sp.]|uniref:hypothetical protein n=1 Tax=Tropicimonas sp. TaxID=2067044 RepID=UPI003A83C03F
MYLGDLFETEPEEWDLGGHAAMWAELRAKFAGEPLPDTPLLLERLLENAYWEATGHSLSFCTEIIVPRFAGPGSPRGGVSGATWRYRLFPMIVERYKAARK